MTALQVPRRHLLAAAATIPAAGLASASKPAKYEAEIDPRQFGARYDGRTDDTAAVQKALDACLAQSPPCALVLSGEARIYRSLIINRPVDRNSGRLRIVGRGGNAGFHAALPIIMFDTTLAGPLHPTSEFISFENLRFSADLQSGATALSARFLRVQITGCDFDAVRACVGQTYAQEWVLERNIARYWRGSFLDASGAFALRSHANKFQHGDTVFDVADETGNFGCVGCSLDGDVMESCSGPYLRAEQTQALRITGLYFEGNAGAAIVVNEKFDGASVTVSGCFFMPQDQSRDDQTLYAVRWGRTCAGISTGNWSGGRLNFGGQNIFSQGDVALHAKCPAAPASGKGR